MKKVHARYLPRGIYLVNINILITFNDLNIVHVGVFVAGVMLARQS